MNPAGGIHNLARRIEGAKIKDVREFLSGIDRDGLPSAAEGRAAAKERRLQAKLLVAFGHDFLDGAENAESLR